MKPTSEWITEWSGVDWEAARSGRIGTAVTLNPEGHWVVLLKVGDQVAELDPTMAHTLGRRLTVEAAMAMRDEVGGDS